MLPVPGHQRRMDDGRTKNPGDQRAKFRRGGGLGRFRQCRLRQLVGRDLVDFPIGWPLDLVRDQRFDRRGNQVLFGRPPAIDGQLADAGPFRDLLDAGALDAAFDEQLKPGTQDRVDTAIVVPTSGGGMLPSLPNDFAALSSSTAIRSAADMDEVGCPELAAADDRMESTRSCWPSSRQRSMSVMGVT